MQKWSFRHRLVIGFLLAPLGPAVLIVALGFLFGIAKAGEAMWFLKLAAVLGYVGAFTLGIPTYFLLRWLGWNSAKAYVSAGGLMGAGLSIVVGALSTATSLGGITTTYLPVSAVCGVVAAISFWLLVRPDHSIK